MKTALEKLSAYTTAKLIQCKDREDWLRNRVIGGSTSPNLYDCGFSSEYAEWSKFVAPPLLDESCERFEIGLGLEPFVINLSMKKFGGQIEPWPQFTIAKHPERDYMHATPDAAIFDDRLGKGPGSFSIKTWSENDRRSWDDEPPLGIQIQVQHELAVLGWDWGVIAVLFGAQELRRFVVHRNDDFIRDLYEACGRFWRYVTDRIAPPIDESRASAQAFARLHPNDDGLAVRLPVEADQLILEFEAAKATIKSAEALEAGHGNKIRELIGDHSFGVTPEGRVYSLKAQDRKDKCCEACGAVVIPGTTFRVLRSTKALPKGTPYSDDVVDYKGSARKQLPEWVKRAMLDAQPNCRWCNCKLTEATATIEHLVPLAVGGTNDRNNLALACEGCNQARGHDATLTAAEIVAKKNALALPSAAINSPLLETTNV
jgi:predicted phage-related endonuclease